MVTQAKEHEAHAIPDWLENDLNTVGTKAIEAAVYAAEKKTAGEIVPLIVKSSTLSPGASIILALIALSLGLILHQELAVHDGWNGTGSWYWSLGLVVFVLLAAFIGRFPWVQLCLTPPIERKRQVHQRALLAFYQANLNQTAGRTGILLFISWRERQAVVLADEGIAKFCDPKTFEDVVGELVRGAKTKDLAGGMVKAITMCGDILAQHIPIQANDRNELHDTLRIID